MSQARLPTEVEARSACLSNLQGAAMRTRLAQSTERKSLKRCSKRYPGYERKYFRIRWASSLPCCARAAPTLRSFCQASRLTQQADSNGSCPPLRAEQYAQYAPTPVVGIICGACRQRPQTAAASTLLAAHLHVVVLRNYPVNLPHVLAYSSPSVRHRLCKDERKRVG